MNNVTQQSSMSITEQQQTSFLGMNVKLDGAIPSLEESFAKFASLPPAQQLRLIKVNNCRIPTVECDLEKSRIIIRNWPGEDVESLTGSPIHEIVDQIKDLYAYGDRSGRAGVAAKRHRKEALENNAFRLCVTYYENVNAAESKDTPATPHDITDEQLVADHLNTKKFDPNQDGNTAIITCVASHFSKGDGQPRRFATIQVSDEDLESLRLAFANSDTTITIVKSGRAGSPNTVRIVHPLNAQGASRLLASFVEQCCNEIRAYIEAAFNTAVTEHIFPDYREACATN